MLKKKKTKKLVILTLANKWWGKLFCLSVLLFDPNGFLALACLIIFLNDEKYLITWRMLFFLPESLFQTCKMKWLVVDKFVCVLYWTGKVSPVCRRCDFDRKKSCSAREPGKEDGTISMVFKKYTSEIHMCVCVYIFDSL